MRQTRVFISHSRQDKRFCSALVRALSLKEVDVWYDENDLNTGQLYEEIIREIRTRPIFIVILSKAALASPWVKKECTWAYSLYDQEPGRTILPVVAGPVEQADFGQLLFLADFKRIEGPGHRPHKQTVAIAMVLRAIGLRIGSEDTFEHQVPAFGISGSSQAAGGLMRRGEELLGQGQFEKALALFERARRRNPDDIIILSKIGTIHDKLGNWTESLAFHEILLRRMPGDIEAWNNKGRALRKLGLFDEALEAYDRALALDSDDAYVWQCRGLTLEQLSRYEEALEAYDQALDRWPYDALTWSNKALSLRALGLEAEADEAERYASELSRALLHEPR